MAGARVREVVVEADDGERLAATLYLPDGEGPFAALLEALPYRKDDVTESYRSTYERYAACLLYTSPSPRD